MAEKTLPQIVSDLYALLEPMDSSDRHKVISSAMMLLGEGSPEPVNSHTHQNESLDKESFTGEKARRWMAQYDITASMIDELFHCDSGRVEIIINDVSGNSKKLKTYNCYLLAGIQAFLEHDEPKFSDSSAVDIAKHMGCYDMKNHSVIRGSLGSIVAGSKTSGYTLPGPGLRAAAQLVKELSKTS